MILSIREKKRAKTILLVVNEQREREERGRNLIKTNDLIVKQEASLCRKPT